MNTVTFTGKPVHFCGVCGVRIGPTTKGWIVQYHPDSDNAATDGWITVGRPFEHRWQAEENAPVLMPDGHEF